MKTTSVLNNNPCFGPAVSFSPASLNDECEKLQKFEQYSHKVTFASIYPYLQPGNSILDLGCGTDEEFPQSILNEGCFYVGVDSEPDAIYMKLVLLSDWSEPQLVLHTETALDFLRSQEDSNYDVVLLSSILLHVVDENERQQLLRESYRVAKQAVFIDEVSWSRLGNNTADIDIRRLFRNFIAASDKLLSSHGRAPRLADKLPSLVARTFPIQKCEIFRIDDRPMGDYRDELLPICKNALNCASYCYEGDDQDNIIRIVMGMQEYLQQPEVQFIPAAYVVAHIPKTNFGKFK